MLRKTSSRAEGKREVETTTLTRREETLCNFLPFSRDRVFEYFLYIFSGFAIDRSKKYIKTIKNYIKIDAVDPFTSTETKQHRFFGPLKRARVTVAAGVRLSTWKV